MAIFYLCPWAQVPMGGIKQIFRHVEALNEAGFDAYVLTIDARIPSWFTSSVSIARLKSSATAWFSQRLRRHRNPLEWIALAAAPLVEMKSIGEVRTERHLGSDDIIVIPEFYGKSLAPCGFGSKIVIFNQNAHYTFNGMSYSDDLSRFVYHGHLLAALAVSNHTFDYLKYAFRNLTVLLTPNGVDGSKFFLREIKRRQIAFMPRKLPKDIVQVLQILRCRGSLNGWELCPIDSLGEDEVAELMRESAVFLSTCHDEGFGLPPLEAGACGCIVIGYSGQAASEFMLPNYCFPVAQGDVLGFAKTLEKIICEYDIDSKNLRRKATEYSIFIHNEYSMELERRRVVEAWKTICGANTKYYTS